MLKKLLLVLASALIFTACGKKNPDTVFLGTIEEISGSSVLVRTEELSAGDLIWIDTQGLGLEFSPARGQTVRVSISPEIKESYPLQGDAIKMELTELPPADPAGQPEALTSEQARELMTSGEDYVILDVRTQTDFDQGHLPGAIVIPAANVKGEAPHRLDNPELPVLVYGQTSQQSKEAAQILASLGYSRVYDIGSVDGWGDSLEVSNP